jgi:hypothetical protein
MHLKSGSRVHISLRYTSESSRSAACMTERTPVRDTEIVNPPLLVNVAYTSTEIKTRGLFLLTETKQKTINIPRGLGSKPTVITVARLRLL